MKHEVINSIGVILTLCLGAATAWHEFSPKKDIITLTTENRVELGARLDAQPFGAIDLDTGENQPIIGPVTWKIRVHNPTERSISLVSFEAFLLTTEGAPVYYSAMRERLSPIDAPSSVQPLPENIPPFESRAYLVSLFVPYKTDEGSQSKCEERFTSLQEVQACFFQRGRDLFGNKVDYVDTGGGRFAAIMQEAFNGPRFAVVLETADGSRFSTNLSFLPGGQ
ncbi:hypothetical protein [Pseudooceanicola marinus]|uniref:hypothetical protein n=1 Tax=Pseudooceanicola marinus TaxID=396013 RepID=UPI00117A9C6E|nr:hypothetical protein [Pseudooceanicola marinus]